MIPEGTVTFLFTDIEGSTRLVQRFPDAHESILERHNSILTQSIEKNRGFIFKKLGDAFYASFESASDAVRAAAQAQTSMHYESWGDADVKVRMGIHTGEAEFNSGEYVGYITLTRVQRLMSSANGGQTLISEDTYELLNDEFKLRNLGERKLKDLVRPINIFQLLIDGIPNEFPPIKTLDARRHNLPVQSTAFIGRTEELSEMKLILNENRLLTITGPGGTGKTRLSIKLADGVIDEFENGVWFVELASISDPENVVREIASVLKINVDTAKQPIDSVIDFMRDKEMLLILDNCEHLISACSIIIERLLQSCGKIKVIATSRETLKIQGETVYPLPSLSLPDMKKPVNEKNVSDYEAVKLFIDRAMLVNSRFSVSNANASAVAELCNRLDGIPLAIELAAARIKVLSVENILDKINDRFRLFTTGSRTALPRQQTLKAMIDWSYDLLSDKEKTLFERLSVFSGGCSLEAAEYVCASNGLEEFEIMDLLGKLLDKSLVVRNESDGNYRYSMLETIKTYAGEIFKETEKFMIRHNQYFYQFCHSRLSQKGAVQINDYKEVREEIDNIRASIDWGIESEPSLALQLVNETGECWELNGSIAEGYEFYRKLLAKKINYEDRLKSFALINAGYYASQLGKFEDSINYLNESLKICERIDDKILLALCYNNIGNYYFISDNIHQSVVYHEKALNLGRETGDEQTIGLSIVNLAAASTFFGEADKAYDQYMEGLRIFRKLGDKLSIARLLIQLASTSWKKEEQIKNAKACYEESIPILKEYGDQIPLCFSLVNLGNVSLEQGNIKEAELLYEESLYTSKEYGYSSTYIHALIKLAEIEIMRNQLSKAAKMLDECFALCNSQSDKYKLILSFRALGIYFFQNKRSAEAIKAFLFSRRLAAEIGFGKSKKKDLEIEKKLENLKAECGEEKVGEISDAVNELSILDAIEFARNGLMNIPGNG